MSSKTPTVLFLFFFLIVFFDFHLQPCLSQSINNVDVPNADPSAASSVAGWYDVFIQPYKETEKLQGDQVKEPEMIKNTNFESKSTMQAGEEVEEPKVAEKPSLKSESTNTPAPATAPAVASKPADAWLDTLISKVPGFTTLAPQPFRLLIGTMLQLLKESSDSYNEISQFWNLNKADFPVSSLTEELKMLSDLGTASPAYLLSRDESVSDEKVEPLLANLGVSRRSSYFLTRAKVFASYAPQTLVIIQNSTFHLSDEAIVSYNPDKYGPFYTSTNKADEAKFNQIIGKIPVYQTEKVKAMVLKQKLSNLKSAENRLSTYFIATSNMQFSSAVFDEVRRQLKNTPTNDATVTFPSFYASKEFSWGSPSFPKFFGRKHTDSDILGPVLGGGLAQENIACMDGKVGAFSSFSHFDLYKEKETLAENRPSPLPSNAPLTSFAQGDGIVFDKPFFFVLYDEAANFILQVVHVDSALIHDQTCAN